MRGNDDVVDDDLGLAWETDEPGGRHSEPATRQFRRQRRENRRRKGRSYIALVISAALLLVIGLGVYWGIGQLRQLDAFQEFFADDYAEGDMGETITFRVGEGDGGTVIADNLVEAGVVKSRAAFVNLCEARRAECLSIQPGGYQVQLRSPAEVVFNILIDPSNKNTTQFTIQEGLSVIQTLHELARQTGIPLADFQAAANPAALGITPEWYQRTNGDGKPNAVEQRGSIEGFLFPNTYFYDPTYTAHDILKMMVDQFFVVANRVDLRGRAQALGISPYEVLITASLLEAEGLEQDFAKIARVAYNRVYKDMISCDCLQFDSTARYWQELQAGVPRQAGGSTGPLNDPNNPYNTYDKTPGMPLGPISNPGEAALNAAAHPADGDWLYFVVVRPDGTTAFASTLAQHCDYVREGIRNGVDLNPNC